MDGYPRAVLRRGALLLLSALVAGCGALPGPTPQPEPLTSTAETTSETFTSPTTEGTTTTTPDPDPNDGPVINLARLPIGGAPTVGDDPTRQCVTVNWIVSADADPVIPAGYSVEVKKAEFDAQGFDVEPGGCGTEKPNCLGHVMRAGHQTCDLAVRSLEEPRAIGTVQVSLAGDLKCPKSGIACRRFADTVREGPRFAIELEEPPPPTTSGTSGTTDGTTTTNPTTGTGAPLGLGPPADLPGSGA